MPIFVDRRYRMIELGALVWALLCLPIFAQDLPKEIRGYKLHRVNILVRNASDKQPQKDKSEAYIRIGEPELADISLSGISFEISAEIGALEQSGTVEFLTFHDFRVNGLAVEIEEYRNSFSLRKNRPTMLPKPARIFMGSGGVLQAAWKELSETKDEWTVTGRVFVYGKFRKMGFNFKRVVAVEINLKIKNPLISDKS